MPHSAATAPPRDGAVASPAEARKRARPRASRSSPAEPELVALPFRVAAWSSEDGLCPAAALEQAALELPGANAEERSGWCTRTHCPWPQTLAFEFDGCVRIDHICIASHSSRIPTKVAITLIPSPARSENNPLHAGELEFASNLLDNFAACEEKIAHLDAYACGVILELKGCHHNKHNIFRQAQLLYVQFHGTPTPLLEQIAPAWAVPHASLSSAGSHPVAQAVKQAAPRLPLDYEVVDDRWLYSEGIRHGAMTEVDLALLSVGVDPALINDTASRWRITRSAARLLEALAKHADQLSKLSPEVNVEHLHSKLVAASLTIRELGTEQTSLVQRKLDRLEQRDHEGAIRTMEDCAAIQAEMERVAQEALDQSQDALARFATSRTVHDQAGTHRSTATRTEKSRSLDQERNAAQSSRIAATPVSARPESQPPTTRSTVDEDREADPFKTRDKTPRTPPLSSRTRAIPAEPQDWQRPSDELTEAEERAPETVAHNEPMEGQITAGRMHSSRNHNDDLFEEAKQALEPEEEKEEKHLETQDGIEQGVHERHSGRTEPTSRSQPRTSHITQRRASAQGDESDGTAAETKTQDQFDQEDSRIARTLETPELNPPDEGDAIIQGESGPFEATRPNPATWRDIPLRTDEEDRTRERMAHYLLEHDLRPAAVDMLQWKAKDGLERQFGRFLIQCIDSANPPAVQEGALIVLEASLADIGHETHVEPEHMMDLVSRTVEADLTEKQVHVLAQIFRQWFRLPQVVSCLADQQALTRLLAYQFCASPNMALSAECGEVIEELGRDRYHHPLLLAGEVAKHLPTHLANHDVARQDSLCRCVASLLESCNPATDNYGIHELEALDLARSSIDRLVQKGVENDHLDHVKALLAEFPRPASGDDASEDTPGNKRGVPGGVAPEEPTRVASKTGDEAPVSASSKVDAAEEKNEDEFEEKSAEKPVKNKGASRACAIM